jgi:hypothetical protein
MLLIICVEKTGSVAMLCIFKIKIQDFILQVRKTLIKVLNSEAESDEFICELLPVFNKG